MKGPTVHHLLIHGDSRRIPLADGSVHCCVTSPPYFGLRDYSVEGQIGLEATPACGRNGKLRLRRDLTEADLEYFEPAECGRCFVCAIVEVFREVKRVLRDDGCAWVNLGDSYNSSPSNQNGHASATFHGESVEPWSMQGRRKRDVPDLKPKDLIGIPWRVAFALQADGWYLRSDIIWCLSGGTRLWVKSQKGVMPMSIKDMVRLNPATVQLWNGTKWTRVLGWSRSPDRGEPLEIMLRSGERIGCTPGHVWPTKRGNVRADELKPGDLILSTKLPGPDVPTTPAQIPDFEVGWFVGLYIAEGSMDSTGTIQIAGHTKEVDRLRRLEALAEAYHGTCRLHVHGENSCTINLDGPMIRGLVESYVAGRTAKDKHLTVKAWQRSADFLESVLTGYLSGDGHWDAPNRRYRLGFTANDQWAADLRTICARIGASLRVGRAMHAMAGRKFPGYRGEIRFTRSDHHNNREDCEVIEIGRSRGRGFWDIGVEDEPHLFALASGVLTHNSKPNPMPESVTDRPTKSHEYLFMLTKSPRYWYDPEGVREAAEYGRRSNFRGGGAYLNQDRFHGNGQKNGESSTTSGADPSAGRNLRSVWSIPTEAYPGAHFATFPRKLAEPPILASCPARCCPRCGKGWVREVERESRYEGKSDAPWLAGSSRKRHAAMIDGRNYLPSAKITTLGFRPSCSCLPADSVPGIVLDPFCGSGTAGVVALAHHRRFIGVDLSPAYLEMARRRIERPHAPARQREKPLPLFDRYE